jgi:hypothetical protein
VNLFSLAYFSHGTNDDVNSSANYHTSDIRYVEAQVGAIKLLHGRINKSSMHDNFSENQKSKG